MLATWQTDALSVARMPGGSERSDIEINIGRRREKEGEHRSVLKWRVGMREMKSQSAWFFCSVTFFFATFSGIGRCWEEGEADPIVKTRMAMTGGVREVGGSQNSAEIEDLARFAVQEHNKKENALLEFARVVKAKEQVVAGTLHHLTLEATEAGQKKLYEAKVWVKPWLDFKVLQEFKHASDSSFTPADLGVKQDEHGLGWRTVPAHDPGVQDAANHAVKTIQQRSNSLAPYELLEILLAKAELIEEFAKFDLLLKVKRGSKEEKYKVEVHKNAEGTFLLNQMQQEHSDSGN